MPARPLTFSLCLCLLVITPTTIAEQQPRIDQGLNWDYCAQPHRESDLTVPASPLPNQHLQLAADSMEFDQETGLSLLTGGVQLWRLEGYAEADRIEFDHQRRVADLFGNLFIQQTGLRATATQGHLELDEDRGWLRDTRFRLTQGNARGSAGLINLTGKDQSRYEQVVYSTCPPDRSDWSLVASELEIDMAEGWGSARHARLQLAGLPVFYMPYFTFPVDERRKTGLLIPSIGSSNRLGSELTLPYYFNLAPNYDATLTPRLMSKRGVMLGGELRYLGERHRAEISGEILPSDKQISPDHAERRSALRFIHVSHPYPGLTTRIDTNAVSDNDYLEDFGTGLVITSTRHLERVGEVRYNLGNWSLLGRVQRFQTVDDSLSESQHPYRRLPQLTSRYRGFINPLGLNIGFSGEYTHFKHDTLSDGERLSLRPSLSLPLRRSWGHLIPRLSLNYASYRLDEEDDPENETPDYFVPAYSLDGGLVFERDTHWFGIPAQQTLEPRLFVLYAPFDDQSDIPDFDSADLDLSFTNLFKENRFSGRDRFGDARQISFGLTSRWFQSENGMERLRASIGQIYYGEDREVQLTGATEDDPSSAIVAELSSRLGSHWRTTLTLRHNPHLDDEQIDRGRFTLRYSTPEQKQINIDYNFKRDSIEDLDFSFYWPFGHEFSLFGKWKHSYLYERNMNRILGLEYGGHCCWKLRTLLQRYVANEDKDEEEETRFMLQLELRGLGALGHTVDRTMQETIYGYHNER
ncbi:LPS-assembly protein LptD [Candidatus Thiodiazotropha sp. CDECU1]|uniref:LPS-assembly protein LptD n=1 Tax=Candidatus Thiodiazotropha sp. CDECU1 TaxID=3065865 RepID=UPI00292CC86C|nr:LPS assembly protein LptD [Candidatus Thiodiazotropha sp. CDECU1]